MNEYDDDGNEISEVEKQYNVRLPFAAIALMMVILAYIVWTVMYMAYNGSMAALAALCGMFAIGYLLQRLV